MRAKNSDFLTRLPAYGATPHSSTLVLYSSSDLGANWQNLWGLETQKNLGSKTS